MNENTIKNGSVYVTWKQLIFIAGVIMLVLGGMITTGLDTRERIIRVETVLEGLVRSIDNGQISIQRTWSTN